MTFSSTVQVCMYAHNLHVQTYGPYIQLPTGFNEKHKISFGTRNHTTAHECMLRALGPI